ncbi:phage tail protein [Thalassiella azotivora]
MGAAVTRERAQEPAGAVAVADRTAAPARSAGPVTTGALALQGTAGNGAVARLTASGGSTAVLTPGAVPTAPVPTGPIPEMVPATSAREARQAEDRSWWDDVKDAVSSALSSVGAGLGALTSRVLGAVAGRARSIPGYGLLSVALGKDLVTGQQVPRTATNVVGGLVGLVPGGAGIFANLQATGAIEKAAAWFGTAWEKLGLTWDYLRGLFRRAWDALGVRDLLDPAGVWDKLKAVFAAPLQRVLAFAASAGSKLLELVFEGGLSLAGSLGGQVMAVIRRAGSVLGTVFRDPVGFAGRLVAAVRGGFGQFAARIGHHLRQGLFGWLTGALRGAITLPERFDLRGILSLVLQLVGATWSWLRTRMVRLLGEPRVAMIERAVDWVQRIATEGLSAVWERIAEFATGLVDTVIGSIRDWVGRTVVGAAISRLVTMFNPAGAVIQAIIAAYNTIRFFIERAQQLASLANAVFGSIAAIASGALGNAMNAVENALSKALPVAIGFLARLIGLGDVATPVKNLIGRARGVLDRALDKVVNWLADRAKRLGTGLQKAGRVVTKRVESGLSAGRARLAAIGAKFGILRRSFTMRAHPHRITLSPGRTGSVTMASVADELLLAKINREILLSEGNPAQVQAAKALLPLATKLAELNAGMPTSVEPSDRTPEQLKAHQHVQQSVQLALDRVVIALGRYAKAYGVADLGNRTKPVNLEELKKQAATAYSAACEAQQAWLKRRPKSKKTFSSDGWRTIMSGWGSDNSRRYSFDALRHMIVSAEVSEEQTRLGYPQKLIAALPEQPLSNAEFRELAERVWHRVSGKAARSEDKGTPGRYWHAHAERQVRALTGASGIGVSKEVCATCVSALERHAQTAGAPIVVRDPRGFLVFRPDGTSSYEM